MARRRSPGSWRRLGLVAPVCGRSAGCSNAMVWSRAGVGRTLRRAPPIRACAPSARATFTNRISSDPAFCAARFAFTACTVSMWRRGGVACNKCQPQQSADPRCVLGDLVAIGHPRASTDRQRNGLLRQPPHPAGLGPLIRLCLAMGVEPWFIPPAEPWRNGIVEKFNDRWQQFGPLRRPRQGPGGRRSRQWRVRGAAQCALSLQQIGRPDARRRRWRPATPGCGFPSSRRPRAIRCRSPHTAGTI